LTYIFALSGYIGGDVLYEVAKVHPEYEIVCLVRNSDKGAQVASQYSKARLVYGDLDDLSILEEEAKKADIVLREQDRILSCSSEILTPSM